MPKSAKRGDQDVIRHAYENVLTACARLASFATGKPTGSIDGLIDSRQGVLATDDLMAFAISARRLMDNGASLQQFIGASIDVEEGKSTTKKPVTKIINTIVHHRFIRVMRFSYELDILNEVPLEKLDILHVNITSFSPVVLVESDHGERIKFDLRSLVTTFESKILVRIVEACADKGLHLDEDY